MFPRDIWEFLKDNPATSEFGHGHCDEDHINEGDNHEKCLDLAYKFFTVSPGQLNETMIPVYFDIWPEGSSVKPMIHYGQLINTPEEFRYDGSEIKLPNPVQKVNRSSLVCRHSV